MNQLVVCVKCGLKCVFIDKELIVNSFVVKCVECFKTEQEYKTKTMSESATVKVQ